MAHDWKATIDTARKEWVLGVASLCPDLKFPPEWIATCEEEWYISFRKLEDGEIDYEPELHTMAGTPDGASFKDWIDNFRPTDLKPGEEERFSAHVDWIRLIENDFICVGMPLDIIEQAISRLRRFQPFYNDFEMLRFQEEYFMERIYLHIASELDMKFDALQEVKEELAFVAEVLSTMLEDEMGGFVWSEEDRKKDRESNVRRRRKAVQ